MTATSSPRAIASHSPTMKTTPSASIRSRSRDRTRRTDRSSGLIIPEPLRRVCEVVLQIEVLGAPQIEVDGQPLVVDTRKAIALLAYLAVVDRPIARDSLAE